MEIDSDLTIVEYAGDLADIIAEIKSDEIQRIVENADTDCENPLEGCSIQLPIKDILNEDGVDMELASEGGIQHTFAQAAVFAVIDHPDFDYDTKDDESKRSYGLAVEFTDLPEVVEISLDESKSDYIGDNVAVRGRVRQMTDPIPVRRKIEYQCRRCGTVQAHEPERTDEHIVEGYTPQPPECELENCNSTDFRVSGGETKDYRFLIVEQENNGNTSDIDTWVFSEDYIENAMDVSDGDRVTIYGELCLDSESEPSEYYIKAESVVSQDREQSVELTEDDKEDVKEMVDEMDNPLERSAENLEPTIYGNDLAKRVLSLAAVGSGFDSRKENIHTILIGDPETGKSDLTEAVQEIVPDTLSVDMAQSTEVGLTASAVKETIAGSEEWVVKSGAISMASGGILTVDELDKADFDLSKLNGALSAGKINVSKAGADTKIETDTQIIATANPETVSFDPSEPLDDQIQFSADVVSRFDLAIPFIDDSEDQERNEGIMNAIGADYLDETELPDEFGEYTRDIGLQKMQKWFAMSQLQDPRLTTEAIEEIKQGWKVLRSAPDSAISIGPRRLRGAIRLSRAHARLRLADEVTAEDANVAFSLVSEMLGEWGYEIDRPSKTEEQEYDGQPNYEMDISELVRQTAQDGKSADKIIDKYNIDEQYHGEVRDIVRRVNRGELEESLIGSGDDDEDEDEDETDFGEELATPMADGGDTSDNGD